jgi:hypothetical protein
MDEFKMTRDDIIRMAREAGLPYEYDTGRILYLKQLERFASLVAAAEREAMIEQGWRQCAKDQRTTQFCGMVEQAVLAEREACAKVCEAQENKVVARHPARIEFDPNTMMGRKCATAIRARGQK